MSILFSIISDEIADELNPERTTKQMWNVLKMKSEWVSCLMKARVQSLKRDYENLTMEDDKVILNYLSKLYKTMVELKGFSEKVSNVEVSGKLLHSVFGKFDTITKSIEQF